MEALKAENFELREDAKQLKLLVEKMGVKWMLQAKQEEDSCDSQQEVMALFSRKKIFSTTAKDDATQSSIQKIILLLINLEMIIMFTANSEPIGKVNLKEKAKTWLVEEGLDCTSPSQAYLFNIFLVFSMFSLLKKVFLLCLLKFAVYWKKSMKRVGKKPSIFRMISKWATKYAIQMMPKVLLLGIGTDFMFLILMSFPAYVFQYLS